MPYNEKQYDAAIDFVASADDNLSFSEWDQKRIGVYDLYENIYRNATVTLKIVLRGEDQTAVLMPNGKKIVEATSRFLGKNVGYLVEARGDEGAQQEVEAWWSDFWLREAFPQKFNSNKRWGLVRGDSIFYIYARPEKVQGKRICVEELDPRCVFEIEDDPKDPKRTTGVHIIELVQDWREPDKPEKKVVKRRTFRRQFGEDGEGIAVTSELTFWELGKWDDRTVKAREKQERVPNADLDEDEYELEQPVTQLPLYKWRNDPPQNSSWGTSQLAGLETLLYALNQSLSDEDQVLVFQGLGMYVTDAAPPIDPNTNDVADWNIGPKQIIEIATGQKFDRVTGISDLSPMQDHMKFMDDGMSESSGVPQVAIGRVDVTVAESGIALQLQLMPLIAANADKELELIMVLDQMFHDITTMWLPAYEPEQFGNTDIMTDLSVVCVFDDPMPVDRAKEVEEVIALDQAGLVLKSMVVAKLRELGWKYPTTDDLGNPLTDDDIALMLLDQVKQFSVATDPFAASGGLGGDQGGFDEQGNPIDGANPNGNTPDKQLIDLGVTQ